MKKTYTGNLYETSEDWERAQKSRKALVLRSLCGDLGEVVNSLMNLQSYQAADAVWFTLRNINTGCVVVPWELEEVPFGTRMKELGIESLTDVYFE